MSSHFATAKALILVGFATCGVLLLGAALAEELATPAAVESTLVCPAGDATIPSPSAEPFNTPEGFTGNFMAFPRQKTINVEGVYRATSRLTKAHVEELGRIGWIEEIRARDVYFEDDAWTQIARLPRLRSLVVTATNIDDYALSELAASGSLQYIDLTSTLVSDKGVRSLESLQSLRALNLRRTKYVTYKAIRRFEGERPDVKVEYD